MPDLPDPEETPVTTEPDQATEHLGDTAVGRRGLLGMAGVGVAGLAAGFGGGFAVARNRSEEKTDPLHYAFDGENQAGIVTPAQDRMYFAAFDVQTDDRERLISLLQDWTSAARQLTQGKDVGSGPAPYDSPPDDTGEAIGLPPSGLTITFGFGPGLFMDESGKSRFGLAEKKPALLETLPHFPADKLDPARAGGDLCIQACADDPQVAVHAVRNLSRIAFGRAALRWSQLGFGRTSSTSTSQSTPRNLFGFKDGTANLKVEQTDEINTHLWVGRDDDPKAQWLAGGSYLVARRINMHIETWDRTSLREQESITGRDRAEGAPLSGGTEFSEPDFNLMGREGKPLMAMNSHVRLAHPSQNHGVRMLRRGYNFTDGNNALGRLDAGLFFIAFVRNPKTQYIPMQTRMSRQDGLMEYLQHTGSGLFACPPGAKAGEYIGQALFS